ncbi:putative phage tail assembly chaperone, partial [Providencia rettgeri]
RQMIIYRLWRMKTPSEKCPNFVVQNSSPEMQGVEKFILKWVVAKDSDGNVIQLDKVDVFNAHFNTHRSHYYPLIIDGVLFHFSDFLPDGVASKVNMPSLVNLTA